MYILDFETHPIVNGGNKSPIPVGLAIKYDDEPSEYIAWGHPTGNTHTRTDAIMALQKVYNSGEKVLFHNAKFDIRVAHEHMCMPILDGSRILDTMIAMYLLDPRESTLSLKTLTDKYCSMPPEEQKDLNAWLKAHGLKQSEIWRAPVELVGKYARSDVDRTYALYKYVISVVNKMDETMRDNFILSYNREYMLLPIVVQMEMQGIAISGEVHNILNDAQKLMQIQDLQLMAYGNGEKPGSKAMFNVLRRKGLIDEDKITYTDKGNPRYGKEFLTEIVTDPVLLNCLKLRSKLQKYIGTYLSNFAESAKAYNGMYYPYYNQTRSDSDYGTRTGRFSSNIQQLPKDTGDNMSLYADESMYDKLPSIRTLIVPRHADNVLIKRDFSGQELRVVAHYAEGTILEAYKNNPRLDVHAFVDDLIQKKTGHHLKRTPVKMINFLKLYGGGPSKLAEKLSISLSQAKQFFAAYDESLPEFKELMSKIEKLARSGVKIRTWGGRYYDVEPPTHDPKTGQRREYYYKLGNILIQGSSADMTKEAMIRYFYHPDRKGLLLMTVHDELVCEVHKDYADSEMSILRWAMDDIPYWDVPLRSDGAIGTSLGTMQEYEDK